MCSKVHSSDGSSGLCCIGNERVLRVLVGGDIEILVKGLILQYCMDMYGECELVVYSYYSLCKMYGVHG